MSTLEVKLSGLTKPWRVANNEPAMPAMNAPKAKAESLIVVGLSPSATDAVSSSRNASSARPSGSYFSRQTNNPANSAIASTR